MAKTPVEHHAVDIISAVMALLVGLAVLTALLRGFPSWYEAFTRGLPSWHLGALPLFLMILFILLDILLAGFIFWVMRRYAELTNSRPAGAAEVQRIDPAARILTDWQGIELLMRSPNSSDWNMAILRADSLLDDTLRETGIQGATMADRLKVVDPNQLPSLDRVWSAHRLRNAIAHNPTDQHTRETIVSAIASYRQAFRDLGYTTEPTEDMPLPGDAPDNLQLG